MSRDPEKDRCKQCRDPHREDDERYEERPSHPLPVSTVAPQVGSGFLPHRSIRFAANHWVIHVEGGLIARARGDRLRPGSRREGRSSRGSFEPSSPPSSPTGPCATRLSRYTPWGTRSWVLSIIPDPLWGRRDASTATTPQGEDEGSDDEDENDVDQRVRQHARIRLQPGLSLQRERVQVHPTRPFRHPEEDADAGDEQAPVITDVGVPLAAEKVEGAAREAPVSPERPASATVRRSAAAERPSRRRRQPGELRRATALPRVAGQGQDSAQNRARAQKPAMPLAGAEDRGLRECPTWKRRGRGDLHPPGGDGQRSNPKPRVCCDTQDDKHHR